ncbi:hypothetical protein DS2_18810 [Catenovulum agarivorans DS-2]|uniref:DUF3379 domain-containing protein n=1 Tax=Catenovulum agarivorans DS-2 TaxID=1328313 RepID=W7QGU3_9ALTE|nr:DUF3379 family protein [Catenovulum agarivorans]EWH08157.1 hypothetical protein DS2_18810 [Catenovulum agarivorans DS-2]
MDDLEFRRTVFADPKHLDDEIKQAAQADIGKKRFIDDMQNLENNIEQCMKVDVPEDLASRIILRQSLEEHKREQKSKMTWYMATAASVAFAIGIGFSQLSTSPEFTNINQLAMQHVYDDAMYHASLDLDVPLNEVNAKLAGYGAEFTDSIGHIYSANYCQMQAIRALHLVVDGQQGQVNIFVMPKADLKLDWQHIADGKMQSKASRLEVVDVIYVAPKQENIQQVQSHIENKLKWRT